MKRILFFLFCCVLFAASCSKNVILPQERSLVVEKDFQTKGMKEIAPDQLDTAFFVSASDIETYTKFKILLSKGEGQELSVLDIRPVGPTDDVVLCYLINYSEGWEVISPDRRAPVVLASQEGGYLNFDECESNEAMQDVVSWIGYLASDVLCLRQQLEFVPVEEEDIH